MSYSNTDQGDIVITQGDSGFMRVELYEPDGVTPRDLTGITATISVAKVKMNDKGESVVSPAVLVKTCDPNLNDVGERHVLGFAFEPADTNNMKVGDYAYDLELSDGGNYVETIMSQAFTVEYQVTKRGV